MGRFILIYQLTVHRCVCVHCSSFFHGPTVPSFFAKLKIPTYSKHKPSKKTIQTDCKRSVYVTCCYSFTLHPLQINFENKPPFSLLKFHSPSIHPKQKTYNQPNKPIWKLFENRTLANLLAMLCCCTEHAEDFTVPTHGARLVDREAVEFPEVPHPVLSLRSLGKTFQVEPWRLELQRRNILLQYN